MAKNSAYKTLATGILFEKLKNVHISVNHLDRRRLSIDEIKEIIEEEFENAKEVCDVEAKEVHWGDAELEKEVEWAKALDLKEYFKKAK